MSPVLVRLHVALRRLGRDPALVLLTVLSLSLGIGAASTVFSLFNSLLVRPLPGVGAPGELVPLTARPIEIPNFVGGAFRAPLSYPNFEEYRQHVEGFSGLAAFQPVVVHVAKGEWVERVEAEVVSSNYFSVLKVPPAVGRVFDPALHGSGRGGEGAVIAHRLWKALGGDPSLIGEVLHLNGSPFTVVGVAPEDFHGTRIGIRPLVWVPIAGASRVIPAMDPAQLRDPEHGWLFWFIGRLAPGVSLAMAQEQVDAVAAGLLAHGASEEQGAGLELHAATGLLPGQREDAVASLAVLWAVAGFLLLLACLNTAVLLLSRVPRRRAEISVRLALGAPRGSIVRQLLAESVVLAMAGAAGGVLMTFGATRILSKMSFAGFLPETGPVVMDLRVLSFSILLGFVCAVVFGLFPAVRSARGDLTSVLKTSGRVGGGGGALAQHALVIAQVGVSLVLLIGAGLLLRSLDEYREVSPGFDTDNVLNLRLDLERQGYSEGSGRALQRRIIEQVSAIPGVETAAFASSVPLESGGAGAVAQVAPKSGPLAGETEGWIEHDVVSPDYFETLGISLSSGRGFEARDDAGGEPVVVVNESLAEELWPGVNAVGQWLAIGAREARVVGVVSDVRTKSLAAPPEPRFYRSLFQHYRPVVTLHVRARTSPERLLPQVESRIHELDRRLPLFDKVLMSEQLRNALNRPRLAASFVGLFSLLGLFLTVVGIAGVMYRTAVSRLWESSIRLAIGARRGDLVRLFLRRGLITAVVGVALGLAAALALAKGLTGFLYGVSPYEPGVFVGVAGLVLALAVVANAVPAYLATRFDPAKVLRRD